MKTIPKGAYPAMITPFTADGEIDYPAVGRLLRWYERLNCPGVLSLCASSETNKLSLEEKIALSKYIVENKGKMTIIASGHTSDSVEDQLEELNAVAATGVDGICLIVGRLNQHGASDDEYIRNIKTIMNGMNDKEIPLGFYERPGDFNRNLSEKILKFCASTGRFVFLKETSCTIEGITAKINAVKGSNFGIYNANSTLLLESLKAGAAGFCGIMGNFHPDLYQWLCENYEKHPAEAERVSDYIGALSQIACQYPAIAKYHVNSYGAEMTTYVRKSDNRPLNQENTYRIHQTERIVNELRAWIKTIK